MFDEVQAGNGNEALNHLRAIGMNSLQTTLNLLFVVESVNYGRVWDSFGQCEEPDYRREGYKKRAKNTASALKVDKRVRYPA
jgi:hypothetical protein